MRDYDEATHHVRTTAVDAGLGVGTAIDVAASNGDVTHTFMDPSFTDSDSASEIGFGDGTDAAP